MIGTEVKVTPDDDVQIVLSPDTHEFTRDRSPFSLRVAGVLEESGEVIGVYGGVLSGHERYRGQIATLLVRLDHCDWRRDNRSAANFKVGRSVARPNGRHPFYHPDGTDIEGFPFLIRFGSLDSRSGDEAEIDSACEAFDKKKAESGRREGLPPTPPDMRDRSD